MHYMQCGLAGKGANPRGSFDELLAIIGVVEVYTAEVAGMVLAAMGYG